MKAVHVKSFFPKGAPHGPAPSTLKTDANPSASGPYLRHQALDRNPRTRSFSGPDVCALTAWAASALRLRPPGHVIRADQPHRASRRAPQPCRPWQ